MITTRLYGTSRLAKAGYRMGEKAGGMEKSFAAEITDYRGDRKQVTITPIREIGRGRAAIARLVEIEGLFSGHSLCVEKVFTPGLLIRFIYWLFYQSPFPYRLSSDAVLASLCRRRVVAKLISYGGLDLEVSDAYYVRWDRTERAFVLGTEFIEGEGLKVDEADSRMMRRFFHNNLVYPIRRLFGKTSEKEQRRRSEAGELITRMKGAEKLFRGSGLVGSGWQVSPLALVSTANFIKRGPRYVLVDVESGVPSILVPYYLLQSIVRGRFPYFDDIDRDKLEEFCKENVEALREKLGEKGYRDFLEDVSRLVFHSNRWKEGEVAVFRNHLRIFLPKVRAPIRRERIACWYREGILDDAGRERLASSRRFFTSGVFLLGIFPGRTGRFLRKLRGNDSFRDEFKRFFRDADFREEVTRRYIEAHEVRWKQEDRIPSAKSFSNFWGSFSFNLVLSRTTPRSLHRFFSDGDRRKKVLTASFLFVISEKFQTEYAKYVIFRGMREWESDGRLDPSMSRLMKERVEDGSIQEYVRVFGLHVSLKFLEPVTGGIKIVGVGWFLKTFISVYPELNPHGEFTLGLLRAFVGTFFHNPISVIMMINTSVWRTLITLWRMLSIKRRHISYKVALSVGLIPAFGSLAYPMQMYWRCKELSIFLIRHILAKFAHKIPVYGGKHTRSEIWIVRLADIPFEIMEVIKSLLVKLKSMVRRKKRAKNTLLRAAERGASSPPPTPSEAGSEKAPKKIDRLVDEMVERIWERYDEELVS